MSGGKSSTQPASSSPTAPAPAGPGITAQQTSPPPQFGSWYNQLANQAMNLASRSWPGPYPGTTVAQFTPQQTQAFQEIGNIQGQFAPFLNAAGQAYGQATQPLWPSLPQYNVSGLPQAGISAIGQAPQYGAAAAQASTSAPANLASFYSPFTQQVAGNLQNLFNQQNAQQLAQVAGSEVGQGAFGGDRQAVAEALTAQQQNLAQAPVLAQTLQQGFQAAQQQAAQQAALEAQTGLGAGQLNLAAGQGLMQDFSQQQQAQLAAEQANAWLASQAGFGLASLGAQQQQLGLQGAQALGQAGLMQQQLAQEQLNVPYEQWQQMQFWPYQQLQFAAPIVEGVGSFSGGTAATAQPAPSMASQLLGLGALGLGVAGGAGAFKGLFGGGGGATGIGTGVGGSGLTQADMQSLGADLAASGYTGTTTGQAHGGRVGGYQGGGNIGGGLGGVPGSGLGATDVSFTTEPATALGALPSTPDEDVGLPQLSGGQNIRGPGPPTLSSRGAAGTSATGGPSALGTAGSILGDIGSAAKIGATIAGFFNKGGEVDYQFGGAAQHEPQPIGGLPPIPHVPVMWMDMLGKGAGPQEFRGHGVPEAPKPPSQPQEGFAKTLADAGKSLSLGQDLQKSFSGTTPGGTSTSQDSPSEAHQGGSYQAGGQIDPQAGFGMTSDLLRAGGGNHPVLNSLGAPRGGLAGGSFGSGSGINGPNLGFQIPHHFRLQAGGMEAEAEASPSGATSSMMSPMMQGAYQQMAGRSLEQLQELAGRYPPDTPYGQIIQRVIRIKEMAPPQQAAGQESSAQLIAQMGQTPTTNLPMSFLPLMSSASAGETPQPLGGGSLGGTAQTQQGQMQRGGDAGPRNYVTEDELDPHPVVDTSGESIVVHYPSEGSSLDLGLPTSFKRHALAKYGGRVRMQTGGATPPQYGGMMGMPAWDFTGFNQGYPGVSGPGFNAMGRSPGFQFEPSQMGWFGAGAGYMPSNNPFAGISPVQFPNVGQATIPRPMTYANLAGPQISGSTYGLGQTAQVQNPPPVPFSSLGATPPPQNFGGPSGVSPAAQGGRIGLQDGGDSDPSTLQDVPLDQNTMEMLRRSGLDPAALARVQAAPSRRGALPTRPPLQWLGQQTGAPFGQNRQPITIGPSVGAGITYPGHTDPASVIGTPPLASAPPAPLPPPQGPVTTGYGGTTIAGQPALQPPGMRDSQPWWSEAASRPLIGDPTVQAPVEPPPPRPQRKPTPPPTRTPGLGQRPQQQAQPLTADELNRQELGWVLSGHTTALPTSPADRLNAQEVAQLQAGRGLGQQPSTADALNRQELGRLQPTQLTPASIASWGSMPPGGGWMGTTSFRPGWDRQPAGTGPARSPDMYQPQTDPATGVRYRAPGWMMPSEAPFAQPVEATGFAQPVLSTAPVTPVERTALAPLPTAAQGERIRLQGGGDPTPSEQADPTSPFYAPPSLAAPPADTRPESTLVERTDPTSPFYGPPQTPSEASTRPSVEAPPPRPGRKPPPPPQTPSEAATRPGVKDPAARPIPDDMPRPAPPPPVMPVVAPGPGLGTPHPQAPTTGGGLGGATAGYQEAIQRAIDRLEQHQQGHDFYGSPWMALTAAGLGMMGGTSPWPLVNIGRGGLQGLQMYAQQQQVQPKLELERVQAAQAEAEMETWPYSMQLNQQLLGDILGGQTGQQGASGAPPGAPPGSGIIPPPPGGAPLPAGTISADAIAPGGRLEQQYGRYAPAVVAEWQKMGLTPAVIQAGLISADHEGKLRQPWVPGDGNESFGSWQFNIHGQLPHYQAWAREHGIQNPEQDVPAQGRFVMERTEQLHPGFSKIQDPQEAVRLMTSVFERPKNLEKDTATRLADIPRVQAALGAEARPAEGGRPVQVAQGPATTMTDAGPGYGVPAGGPTAHPQQPGMPAAVPTAQTRAQVIIGSAGFAMPMPGPGTEVYDQNYRVEQDQIAQEQRSIRGQTAMLAFQRPGAAQAGYNALATRLAALQAREQAYVELINKDPRMAAPREAAIEAAKQAQIIHSIRPGGGALWSQTGGTLAQSGMPVDQVLTSGPYAGNTMRTFVYPQVATPGGGAPTGPQVAPAADGTPQPGMTGSGQLGMPGMPAAPGYPQGITVKAPVQERYLTHTADEEVRVANETRELSETARQQLVPLNQMMMDADKIYSGPGAELRHQVLRILRPINPTKFDEQVASAEDFIKNQGVLIRTATREASPRAAFQEMRFISDQLPSMTMSAKGLQRVLSEYQGLADYRIAKAKAQYNWEMANGGPGNVRGFEEAWDGTAPVTPYTFVIHRMPAEERNALYIKMAQTEEGKMALARIRAEDIFATQNGLYQ